MTFEEYLVNPNYLVEDLIGEKLEYLFILESPHNDEVNEKYPAAGETGKDMAKYLRGKTIRDEALVSLVKSGKYDHIGIMKLI